MLPVGYTIQEIADALHVSVETLRREIRAGRLRALRIGTRVDIIIDADLEEWMKLCRERNAPEAPGVRATARMINGGTGGVSVFNTPQAKEHQDILRERLMLEPGTKRKR